jgi:hypothetical protein
MRLQPGLPSFSALMLSPAPNQAAGETAAKVCPVLYPDAPAGSWQPPQKSMQANLMPKGSATPEHAGQIVLQITKKG